MFCMIFMICVLLDCGITSPLSALLPMFQEDNVAPKVLNDTREVGVIGFDYYPDAYNLCHGKWSAIGKDAFIIKAIASKLGIKHCINIRHANKNTTYLWGMAVTMASELPPELVFAYPHYSDSYCLFVQRETPTKYTIFDAFSVSMWIATVLSVVSFSLTLRINGIRTSPFDAFTAFVTGGFRERSHAPHINGLFLIISAAGLIVLNALSGHFTSFLTVEIEAQQINTLKEASERLTKIYDIMNIRKEMSGIDDEVINRLALKTIIHPGRYGITLDKMLYDIVNSPTIALGWPKHMLHYEMLKNPHWYLSNGFLLTHMIEECPLPVNYFALVHHKDFPFATKVHDMIMRIMDSGIPSFLEEYSKELWWKLGRIKMYRIPLQHYDSRPNETLPLKFDDIWYFLNLLITGLCVAFTVFILEVLVAKKTIILKRIRQMKICRKAK